MSDRLQQTIFSTTDPGIESVAAAKMESKGN
jgi:hypothetical protein